MAVPAAHTTQRRPVEPRPSQTRDLTVTTLPSLSLFLLLLLLLLDVAVAVFDRPAATNTFALGRRRSCKQGYKNEREKDEEATDDDERPPEHEEGDADGNNG